MFRQIQVSIRGKAMERKNGPWTITSTEQKHKDKYVEFHVDDVIKPDGRRGQYAVMMMVPGVSVLALDKEGFVYLLKEFRYAVGKESVEVVNGAIDEGEEPAFAAGRELREELGIIASELTLLGVIDAVTSQVYSPSHIYLARGLKFGEHEREGSEVIEPFKVRLEEAVQMVLDGRITQALSCVLILMIEKHLQGEARA